MIALLAGVITALLAAMIFACIYATVTGEQ
jgi:hypothetical protein